MILIPDFILAFGLLAWGSLFLLGKSHSITKDWVIPISLFVFCFVSFGYLELSGSKLAPLGSQVRLPESLHFIRYALWFSFFLLTLQAFRSVDVAKRHTPTVVLVSLCSLLFVDLLLLSNHLALSFILLILINFLRLYLSGVGANGSLAAEGMFKQWISSALLLVIALCSLQLVALKAGSLQYDAMAAYFLKMNGATLEQFGMILSISLPFLLSAGIFPFTFLHTDAAQGSSWTVLSVSSVSINGAVLASLWKTALLVFPIASQHFEPNRMLNGIFLFSGFWVAIFCVTQKQPKRFFAGLLSLVWTLSLLAGFEGGESGIAITTFAITVNFLWAPIFALAWSSFFDQSGIEDLMDVTGVAKIRQSLGVFYFLVLAMPTCLPGFPGFITAPRQLTVLLHRGEVIEFFLLGILQAILFLLLSTMIARILFGNPNKELEQPEASFGIMRHAIFGKIAIYVTLFTLLGFGIFGNRSVHLFEKVAKTFLN